MHIMLVRTLRVCCKNAEVEPLTCAIVTVSCGLEVVGPRKTCRNAEIQLVVVENVRRKAPVGLTAEATKQG